MCGCVIGSCQPLTPQQGCLTGTPAPALQLPAAMDCQGIFQILNNNGLAVALSGRMTIKESFRYSTRASKQCNRRLQPSANRSRVDRHSQTHMSLARDGVTLSRPIRKLQCAITEKCYNKRGCTWDAEYTSVSLAVVSGRSLLIADLFNCNSTRSTSHCLRKLLEEFSGAL
jgi:hypothetical protein